MPHTSIIDFKRPLLLATASPARRELVTETGLKFMANAVDIDETSLPNEKIKEYVERLSKAKSLAVKYPFKDAVIITVDTAVGIDDEIIGKPKDERHARETLKKLSGRTHMVISSISVRDTITNEIFSETTETDVTFEDLSPENIDWYISTLEWKSRAGGYAIQGKGSALIKEVHGCFTNVIGISIPTLIRLLKNIK